jgi:hypothetical protein
MAQWGFLIVVCGLRSLFIVRTIHIIYATPSVDEQVDFLHGALRGFFNAHVPLKRGRRRPLVNPWYNAFIEKSIIDCDMEFRFWRSYRSYRERNKDHNLADTKKNTFFQKSVYWLNKNAALSYHNTNEIWWFGIGIHIYKLYFDHLFRPFSGRNI